MSSLSDIVPSGVVTGDDLVNLLDHARANSYAIPAVNCTRYVDQRPSSSFDERIIYCLRQSLFVTGSDI
jgi:hypothetical protein